MSTVNRVEFTGDLIDKTGYFVWIFSKKCKRVRIICYGIMILFAMFFLTGVLRQLILHASPKFALIFFFANLIMSILVFLVFPLYYRKKVIDSMRPQYPQTVAMNDKYLTLSVAGKKYNMKWFSFVDIHETKEYYFLFAEDFYIIIDKLGFPIGGEEIFRRFHTPARLLKEAKRRTVTDRCLVITEKDYITWLVNFYRSHFSKGE